jgi:CheY-like chemotaxis protein
MELIEAERDRAAEASRAKTEYLSRMSHELRTPMTVILGFADLIKLHAPDEENQAVDSILRAGSHLLSLINDALDISRIESGKELLTLAPVRLDTVIEESAQLMRPLAEARNTTLEVSVAEGVAEHVQADRQRLAQVMLNLLSNAVKYAEVGSSVKLRVTMAGRRRVCVSVADNGPGIAPDKLPLVFEPFERLGAERSATPGTGLGLALTKRLVDAMGGAIGVESALGSGTTFWVELNVADRAPDTTSEPQAVASAGAVAAAAEETVLYVEDNVATIQLVSEIFTLRPSIRLLTAMQGSLAFELALQHQPRMIIIDVHLPDMDGFELLQRFKADTRTRDVPVVVLSADATQWQRDRLLGGGASQYLTKPVSVSELLEVVDATIGAAQAEGAAAGAAAEGSPAAV